MEPLPDSYRLLRRGSRWYYVRRVPSDLRVLVGSAVIKKALETSDKTEAKKLRSVRDLETDAWFASLRAGNSSHHPVDDGSSKPSPKPFSTPSMLLSYIRQYVADDDQRSAASIVADPPENMDELTELRTEAESAIYELGDPGSGIRDQMIHAARKNILGGPKEDVDPNVEHEFNDLVRRALVELYRRKLARYDDDYNKPFFDPIFGPTPADAGTTFQQMAEAYLDERLQDFAINKVSAKRADKVRAAVETVVQIVGAEVLVATVDDAVVQQVRAALAAMPANRNKIYPTLSVAQAIAAAKVDGRPILGSTTQGLYLDAFAGILELARRRAFITVNAADGVKPILKPTLASHELREPFTSAQLKAIFHSEFYQRCAPSSLVPYNGKDRDWRFWFPLVMLFSGLRPNEIAQLRAADIKLTESGTTYFDLTGSGEGAALKQLKTVTSKRRVPVHFQLHKFGLMKFVAERALADGKIAELFPTLKPNTYGNRAWYVSKRF